MNFLKEKKPQLPKRETERETFFLNATPLVQNLKNEMSTQNVTLIALTLALAETLTASVQRQRLYQTETNHSYRRS